MKKAEIPNAMLETLMGYVGSKPMAVLVRKVMALAYKQGYNAGYYDATNTKEHIVHVSTTLTDAEFLTWIANRIVEVYGESPNVDFVLRLKRIAERQVPDTTNDATDDPDAS